MAEITRKDLKKQIKNKEISNLYLLYGDEKMYIKTDTNALIEKLMGKEPPEFNFHSFTDTSSMGDVAVAVQVVPFICEYNCVKISDLNVDKQKKSDFEQLMAILDNVPDSTVVIITMPTLEIDLKKPGANFKSLLSYVKKKGIACNMAQESDISLARQIIKWADSRSIKIEQADAYKLQEYVGFDLNTIKNELDKLCNYVGDGGLITGEHIELLVSKRLEANIYKLAETIISGNSNKAYEILDVLFYQKAEANYIVEVISSAYIDYYRARVAGECGVPFEQAAYDFGYGKRAFVLKMVANQTKKVSTESLRDSLNDIIDVSARLKSVSVNERILAETLVAKLLTYVQRRV